MQKLTFEELAEGLKIDCGKMQFSEQEIIALAKIVDPQPIHLDPEFASKTIYKGIIASGLHAYIEFHKQFWVVLVKDNFLCGLGIDGAIFHNPIFPNMQVRGEFEILTVIPKPEKGTKIVKWQASFYDENEQKIQYVKFTSYHGKQHK